MPALDEASTAALETIQLGQVDRPGLRVELGELGSTSTPSRRRRCPARAHPDLQVALLSDDVPLTTQDLNEGIVRFDYARPYRIGASARADGYCVPQPCRDPGPAPCTTTGPRRLR